MITPNELVVPEDIKGLRYALVRAWREMVKKANYHLIQWKDEGTSIGGVGQVNKVNFTGAGVSSSVTDDTLTVTIGGGGGGGLSDGDYGDITVSGGATVLTIDNDVVTFAKMQNVSAADRLLGRGNGGGAGDIQEITLGTNLSFAGAVLNASGSSPWTALTANIPSGKGVFDYEQTVVDAGVSGTSKIALMLNSGADTDENQPEFLRMNEMVAYPSTGSFNLVMNFSEPHSGDIKLYYQVN